MKIPMKGKRTIVRLASGTTFHIDDPKPENIHIFDIAHHLSQCNRYNGACAWPYSVARHCLHVASILPEDLKLAGLLHDAPEAYLGDIVRPLKVLMDDYQSIESTYQMLVEDVFCLERDVLACSEVKYADCRVMATEMDSELLGWKDILEYPLADIEIRKSNWREDRLSYVLAAGLLCMQVSDREKFLNSPDNAFYLPIGAHKDLTWTGDLKSATERTDEFLQNAIEGCCEMIPKNEIACNNPELLQVCFEMREILSEREMQAQSPAPH